ncbi:DISEASE RESISTANCE PROTEIN RP [Salix koriyanagi]|uniref:DISEASE RESISTANCE PROTEIN RP n=1 Tax=Salix koriyanagi TaxID=2511006 RepID=A0A9Q1AFK3_9ROSI|nr:DISEASE RESISTANCE PROTEIN RP [Salix koriyanagi]
MPYFNCTEEIGKPDSVPEELLGSKSQAGVVPSTSAADGVSSSRVADSTGESSQETFKSNYAKLPDYLKSCLDYSSIVSTRHPVEIGKLVRLLLAEGVIQDKPGDIMEVVAANVVKELIDLGMLREVDDGSEVEVPASYLHLSILKLEKQDYVAKTANSPVRRAIRDDGRDIFPNDEGRLIQSLFIITAERRGYSSGSTGGLSRAYMRNVCGMRFLLVLDLDGKIVYLPDEVGDLIHLRYLGVVNSDLDELPRTLGNLQKLQTLDIRMCGKLSKLPIEVVHIQQLRHLLMSKSIGDCEIRVPEGIGKMVNLHTLSGIYGGDGIARELSALTQIRHLGVKRVSEDHAGELFAAIEKMENLESLSLEAEGCFFEETSPTLFPELDAFSPPPLLQEFYLQGGLTEIPIWLASMENLTRLALSFSYLSESPTSALQFLPKLKHLNLWEAYKAKQIGKEFCSAGGFPALETLKIASDFLVEWTEIATGAFPRLRSLSFSCCSSLVFLPEGLQNISTLQELYLGSMHPDLARRLKGEDNYKIKHIPKLEFCLAFRNFIL